MRAIEIHTLHTTPFGNLNRDDLGAPKEAMFGGHPRGRLSSQSLKRPVRHVLELAASNPADAAVRTRELFNHVADRLVREHGWSETSAAAATHHLNDAFSAGEVMLYVTQSEIAAAVEFLHEHNNAYSGKPPKKAPFDKKAATALLGRPRGTVALLGRFIASLPDARIDGAVQVAHAITTHRTDVEFDYFSAVDDLDSTGAGHIGQLSYLSGTFYKHASVNIDELVANLDGDHTAAVELVRLFVGEFAVTLPSGKVRSTAAGATLPDLVAVVVRDGRPRNLVAAFERPVRRTEAGFAEPSAVALAEYATALDAFAGDDSTFRGYASPRFDLDGLGARQPLGGLVTDAVAAAFAGVS